MLMSPTTRPTTGISSFSASGKLVFSESHWVNRPMGKPGFAVSVIAVWRNGPLSDLADHSSRTWVEPPGGIASPLTSPNVHLHDVCPTLSLSGAVPTFLTSKRCDFVV